MELQSQEISLKYGKGLDTKTNKFTVPIGKMLRLENATFTAVDRIDKRPGNDAMTTSILGGGIINSPVLTTSFNNELVISATASGATINGQRLFSYSPQEDRWIDKGKYTSTKAESKFVGQGILNRQNPTTAILNNIAIFASAGNAGNSLPVYLSIWDMTTQEALLSDFNIVSLTANTGGGPQPNTCCINLGGTQLALVYEQEVVVGPSTTFQLRMITITVSSGGGIVFGAPVTIVTSNVNYFQYSIVPTTTGATILYGSNPGTVITIDTTGTITHTASITGVVGASCIAFDSTTGYSWVYWTSTGHDVAYTIFDSTLSVILVPTQLDNLALGPLITLGIDSITAVNIAPHIQQVAYGFQVGGNFAGLTNHFVYQVQANDSGTKLIGRTGLASSVDIYSQMFTMQDALGNNVPYLAVSNFFGPFAPNAGDDGASGAQSTIFVMDCTIDTAKGTSGVIARLLAGAAGPGTNTQSVINLSPTKVLIAATKNIASAEIPNIAFNYVTLDYADKDINQVISTPSNVLLNGGLITSYDGQPAVESGFNLFPDRIVEVSATTGGTLLDGTYQVFATYRWTDAIGNVQESAPSLPFTFVFSSGSNTNTINFLVPFLTLTQKKNPRQDLGIAIYITAPNEVVPYLYPSTQSSVQPVVAFGNNAIVNYLTVGYNTGIVINTPPVISNPILYTNGGILDNDPPPPTTAMVIHNNRVQLVDSTNPNSQWYSKSISPGTAVSFSGFLLNQIDAHAGPLVALAEMDDKLVLFAQNAPIIISGDGANDAGTGSSLSFPQFIPSDVGCSQSKGVITSPLGVHFKTPKGIYLLDRSLSLKYWGAPVEQFNAQSITSSIIMPGSTQIRFLTGAGFTLVYDYFQDQWGTFTNFQGLSSTIWNGLYVYVRSDGDMYKENPTSFLDKTTPIAVKAQTAWVKTDNIQAFQRLKQFLQLGEFTNGTNPAHAMQVSTAYDYFTNPNLQSFSTPVPFTLASVATTQNSFQYKQYIVQQKCETATFLIEELPTGASGENFTLTDMGIVIGIKKGTFKVGAGQTVA